MTIALDVAERMRASIIEALAVANQPAQAVVNPDGTSIGGASAITSIVPGTGATNLGKAEDAAHASGDVGVMTLTVRKDTAVALAGTDGDYQALITDSTGHLHIAEGFAAAAENNTDGVFMTEETPLSTSSNALDYDSSAALEASSVAKASAGRLYEVDFINTNGSTRYLQFFNSATVPADTAVPFLSFPVAASASFNRSWPKGLYFSTGISWANSSTAATKTIGSADSLAQIGYK